MKKTCSVLLCALLLSLAPTAFAVSEEVGTIGQFFDQLVSLFVEIGEQFPPGGVPAAADEPETGEQFPPGGSPAAAASPETGEEFPPGG